METYPNNPLTLPLVVNHTDDDNNTAWSGDNDDDNDEEMKTMTTRQTRTMRTTSRKLRLMRWTAANLSAIKECKDSAAGERAPVRSMPTVVC